MGDFIKLVTACFFIFIGSIVCADEAGNKVIESENSIKIKVTNIKKDGKDYSQYDFGEGFFSVDNHHIGGGIIGTNNRVKMLLAWPQMEPIGDIQSRLLYAGKGKGEEFYARLMIDMDFSEINGFGGSDIYNLLKNPVYKSQTKKFHEVVSDYPELNKYTDGDVFVYVSEGKNGYKTPQGTPLAFWCFDMKYMYTTHEPAYWTCSVVFQYYGHVAVRAESTGEVLSQWSKFAKDVDGYFKNRVQEK